jgi:hypothetical protein
MTEEYKPTPLEILQISLRRVATSAAMSSAYENWSDEFSRKEILSTWRNEGRNGAKVWEPLTIDDLKSITIEDLKKLGFSLWDDRDEEKLYLIPLWAWNIIADGTPLKSINGETKLKDSTIDLDVRGGCIAYGVVLP